MLKVEKTDFKNNTYRFEVTVGKKRIEKRYKEALDELSKELKVEGFRKGNAPKKIAEEKLSKDKIYEAVIRNLMPQIYQELIKQENLQPVTSPKIELKEAKEDKDWVVAIEVAEKPDIDIKNYKKIVKKAKKESQEADIWVPGSEEKVTKEKQEQDKRKLLNKILDSLLSEASVDVPALIVEREMNRRLTSLVDDIKRVGLSVDEYLKSKNQSMDSLKERMRKEIEDMYKLEFILDEIAGREKITVEKEDFQEFIKNVQDEQARKQAEENSYYYISLIRRQKTFDYLLSL